MNSPGQQTTGVQSEHDLSLADSRSSRHGLANHFSDLTGGVLGRTGRRYSRFVTTMRMGLLFLAAGLIALVVTVGIELRKQEGFNLSFATIDAETGEPAMLNPQFTGMDQENRPFVVRAEKAVQDRDDPRTVNLHNLNAHMAFGAKEKLFVVAPTGRFRQSDMLVFLNAPVELRTSDGYVLKTGAIEIDLKNGTAASKEKLQGTGPLGYFQAGSMSAFGRGKRLYFADGVKVIIKPNQSTGK